MDNNSGMDMKKLRELYEKELEGEGTVSVGISVGNAFTHPSHPGGETGNAGFGPSVQNKGKAGGAFWLCPACKTVNSGKVCTVCGGNRPETEDEKREREQREAEERERRKREEREKKDREAERLKEEARNQKRSKGKKALILSICAAAVLLVLFFAIRGGIQKNAAAKLSQGQDQLQTPVPSQEPAQPESPAPTQAPASETGIRSITQNFDEDVAVTATFNGADTENRLVIELIYRASGIPFSEYRISVDDEGRVSRIEHDVDGERKTTRWLVYDSDLLSSYVIEMNDESIGGLAGDSIVLSNSEGKLWLWGGPGAPEGFDATEWEDLDWGNTVIMDSFDMYTLCLYSPASFPQTGSRNVFVGTAFLGSDGVLSAIMLYDYTGSGTATTHTYDGSLSSVYDEDLDAWVSYSDDNPGQSVHIRESEPTAGELFGLDMSLEDFEQQSARLLETAGTWTRETAPQSLDDFPLFPSSILDLFDTVRSAESRIQISGSELTWTSDLTELLPSTYTGMDYEQTFDYVDSSKNSWAYLPFEPLGKSQYLVVLPEGVRDNNAALNESKLFLSGQSYHSGWNQNLQVSYDISDRHVAGEPFIGLIMSNADYSFSWYYNLFGGVGIGIDIYSYSTGRVWMLIYDPVSGELVNMTK